MNDSLISILLAWYLIQHYQRVHGVRMYSTCLNENPSANAPIPSIASSTPSNESSMLNIDIALFEAALKDMTSSNRPLTSSTTFASNQLIAAANAARSAQQQQQQALSSRTPAGGSVSTGINAKANIPLAGLVPPMPVSPYPSLLQEVAHRSSSFMKLLTEAAKQQCCQTCGKDSTTTTNETISLADAQFLTPKAVDVTSSRVSGICTPKIGIDSLLFLP
jgi:hypothetical protein